MKTLTITDAKKNLAKWLQAAARGEEIGIVAGADVIALRKVEVESTDYDGREYGVSQHELAQVKKKLETEYQRLKKRGQLKVVTPDNLKKKLGLEQAAHHQAATIQTAPEPAARPARVLLGIHQPVAGILRASSCPPRPRHSQAAPIFSNAGRGWDCDCCSGIATRAWNFFVGNRDQVQVFLRSGKHG